MNKISKCRICKNTNLIPILDLDSMALTGIFPSYKEIDVPSSPLKLLKCHGNSDFCGLLQLEFSHKPEEMYGSNYGYKSSLNSSMIKHLQNHVNERLKKFKPHEDDIIIDIGSNDGTTLNLYPKNFKNLVGVDPTGDKFKNSYSNHITLISDFFSKKLIKNIFNEKKAKIITSFSMFYDLEDPISFMKEVYSLLDDNGVWICEQSYMPEMIKQNSYDTICHEHLEFYSLHQINYMSKIVGFNIMDVKFNNINGGSFSVTLKKGSITPLEEKEIKYLIDEEEKLNLFEIKTYENFKKNINTNKVNLLKLLNELKSNGNSISAIGASTKGNVILQFCDINTKLIDYVGEVNKDKFGCFTPGTKIPIISEDELLEKNPDYLLILTWHFKDFFLNNIKFRNKKLIFPLPILEVIET